MNVVASAFIYNAELAMGQLLAQGAAPAIFSTWCGMIATKKRNGDLKHFRRMYDKKVRSQGLSMHARVCSYMHPGVLM